VDCVSRCHGGRVVGGCDHCDGGGLSGRLGGVDRDGGRCCGRGGRF